MSGTFETIPLYKPYITGNESTYIQEVIHSGQIGSNGSYTKKCTEFLEDKYGFAKAILVNSCTNALEIIAMLLDIQPGDEVIVPSYTYVSTANAFAIRGATIIFADSYQWHPNINPDEIEALITPRTRVIIPVHYAGMACDMDAIMNIAARQGIYVVEDAAHGIDNYYINKLGERRPLGSIGHFGVFSFHETKNITSGEGGLLVINDPAFTARAEIVVQKGTNRASFLRGEVANYEWVDLGSSFMPSEITAAFLFAQLEEMQQIQEKRIACWKEYNAAFTELEATGMVSLPAVPTCSEVNGHIFYLCFQDAAQRARVIGFCRNLGIYPSFHYNSLHKTAFNDCGKKQQQILRNSDFFTDNLLRLPLYGGLKPAELARVVNAVYDACMIERPVDTMQ